MKRLGLTFCLVLFLISGCSNKSDMEQKFSALRDDYIELVQVRRNDADNLVEFEEIFKRNLYSYLAANPIKAVTTKEVDKYFSDAADKKMRPVALQGVEKSFQLVLIDRLKNEISTAHANTGNDNGTKSYKLAKELLPVLTIVAERREKFVGSDARLDETIEDAFDELEKGVSNGDKPLAEKAKNTLFESVKEVYFLSVCYEMEGISKYRQSNKTKAMEKLLEAKLFFELIAEDTESIKAEKIRQVLAQPLDEVDLKSLKSMLYDAYPVFKSRYDTSSKSIPVI